MPDSTKSRLSKFRSSLFDLENFSKSPVPSYLAKSFRLRIIEKVSLEIFLSPGGLRNFFGIKSASGDN